MGDKTMNADDIWLEQFLEDEKDREEKRKSVEEMPEPWLKKRLLSLVGPVIFFIFTIFLVSVTR